MDRFGCWAGIKFFCTKKVHVKIIWKQFLYNFMVLLNGPVQNALFCLMDRYRNVCVWFMARNCRFPKVGTHGCQRGNHRLPLQGTAGYQSRLELLVPNLGSMGYHCKQLPVTRGCNLGTIGYHCKELPVPKGWNWRFPTWEPKVTMARMFAFGSWQGTAGSQRLELTVANVGTTGYHCKEPPVPRGWNSWFPTLEPWVTIASNCRLPEVGTHTSQPGNHRLPLQRTSVS